MRRPNHLWTGDWRDEAQRAREEAAERAERARRLRAERLAEAEVAGTSRARANLSRRAVAGLVAGVTAVAAVSAGAFAAGALLGGDAGSVSALPAVSGSPVKPRKGQSQAGVIYAKASPAVVSIRTSDGLGHRLPHRQQRHGRDQRARRRHLRPRHRPLRRRRPHDRRGRSRASTPPATSPC